LAAETVFPFLPPALALIGIGTVVICISRRKTWHAAMVLMATMWATILSIQLTLMPAFVQYLPATRLAARVPVDSVLYTSWEASGWANDFVFDLSTQHKVERLVGDGNNEKLQNVLTSDPVAVAVLWEHEYLQLAEKHPDLKILAEARTFGRGGLTWKKISDPRPEQLLLIGQGH
jgi:hypothetical protein